MADQVSIINAALYHVGKAPITAPTDGSEQARVMTGRWDMARDATLRAHPWNFARARATLPALAAAPAFGWSTQYLLPVDPWCLRALTINDDAAEKFEIEGRNLLCDIAAPLKLAYIGRVTDPAVFDANFAEALALRLASATAYKLTGSKSLGLKLTEAFALFVREGRSVDGQEGTANVQFADDFLNSRG